MKRAEKRTKSPNPSSLLPPSPHKRSHSDVSDHPHSPTSPHPHPHHHRHDSELSVDDSPDVDVDEVVSGWRATVDRLQRDAAYDEQTKLELQSLAEHLTRITRRDKAELSMSLPSFDLTAASAISLISNGSEALPSKEPREVERRLSAVQRERDDAQMSCARLQRELTEERRLMKEVERELGLMKEELYERRRDEEQVHSVLQQARTAMTFHSRKPSSIASTTSAASSAFSDEHKEAEQQLLHDDDLQDTAEAAWREMQRRYVEALKEIEQLQALRREDEARIDEAIRQLRTSREEVSRDYADMIMLSQQVSGQQRDIEQLHQQLQEKEAVIVDLRQQLEGRVGSGLLVDASEGSAMTESMIVGELAEFEGRFKAMQATMEVKEAQLAATEQQLRQLQAECRELRTFAGMQEGTIRKLEKQSQQPSKPSQPTPQQEEALIALAQVSKEYRAEQRLRQSLQETLQLPVLPPLVSPSHSRVGSLGAATQDSSRSGLTPQRLSSAGLSELVWWQQQLRRRRGGSSASSSNSSFSSPANGVRSALSGAFVNEGSGTSTPARSRQPSGTLQPPTPTTQ